MKYKYAIFSLIGMFICIVCAVTISCTCDMYYNRLDIASKDASDYKISVKYITSNDTSDYKTSVKYITSNETLEDYSKVEETVIFAEDPEDYSKVEETVIFTEDPEVPIMYYTEDDVLVATEILYNEARGVNSITNIANVVWCILNRYDTGDYGETIQDVMKSPYQFAYTGKDYSTMEEFDYLYNISSDVFYRWNQEKNGIEDVGRTLPPDYLWFHGNGKYNIFRNSYDSKNASSFVLCDWLISPYES